MRVEYRRSESVCAFEQSLTEVEYQAFQECLRYIALNPRGDTIRTFFYRSLGAIVLFAYRDTQFVINYQWMQYTKPSPALLRLEFITAIYTKDSIHAFSTKLEEP